MRDDEIIAVLSDQNFWFKGHKTGIPREFVPKIKNKLKTGEIIAIGGIRRAGKSYALLQLAEKLIEAGAKERSILIVNFEDYRLEPSLHTLDRIWTLFNQRIFQGKTPCVFLDEIHQVDGWERFVRTLYAKNIPIVVTGSSSKLLSSEYATLLSGRHIEIEIFPFSFREFLKAKGIEIKEDIELYAKKAELIRILYRYLKTGGFPKVVISGDKSILKSYFETIIIKDVAERHNIREIDALKRLATFYMLNFSNKTTLRRTSKNLSIPFETVRRFSDYLQEACFIKPLSSFSISYKKVERSPKKVYIADTGFVDIYTSDVSENVGRFMENCVAIELFRRKAFNPSEQLFYFGTREHEIDFVIKEGPRIKQLIQVTYASEMDEIEKRELRSLIKASKLLKCNNLLCITWDYESEEIFKGKKIKFLPLWKWLLSSQDKMV